MLLAVWLGYGLFSYLPAAGPRRAAFATVGELLLATGTWMTAGMLFAAIVGRRRFRMCFPLLGAAVLGLQAMIIGGWRGADAVGAGLAFVGLLLFGTARFSAVVAVLLIAVAAALQLPSAGAAFLAPDHFGWMPFVSYAKGAERDVVSFLQKSFLYGGAIWLLGAAGLRLSRAAPLVAGGLLAIAWAQARLFGLRAEAGDAVVALLMAAALAVLGSLPPPTPDEPLRM